MKRNFLYKYGFIAIAAVVLAACAPREQKVVIVATNDMHAAIDNFPRLATLVEQLRIENGGQVLLVDAGDRWTGNPFVDLADKPLSPIVELMNELGYDLGTLGNHEFDWGQPILEQRIREMDFPVICANIEVGAGAHLSYIPPYAFIEMNGIRFAFLGLVTNFTLFGRPEGKAENFEGLTFPDVYATAEKYAWLKDSCDVFVGLTHIGDDADTLLAHRLPSLDLIIGGHSHSVVKKPERIGNTIVTQAGSKLRYAGVTTVTKSKKGITVENHLVALDTIPPMQYFEETVKRYNANAELTAPIGETSAPFDKDGIVNMMTDAVREKTGADVALYHIGGVRIDSLDGGISTASLFSLEPFMSEVYILRMTPGQIKGLIINKFNDTINPKESHGPDLFPSGFTYTIITDEAGEAVDVKFGQPEKSIYIIAIPDYMYKNYKFDRSGEARETGFMVTDILKDYIVKNSPIQPDNIRRIRIN